MARRTEWQDVFIGESTPDGAEDPATLMLGTGNQAKGTTIIRQIVRLFFVPASPQATSLDVQKVAVGIGVFSDPEIDAVTYPDPGSSSEIPRSGWLWRDQVLVPETAGSATGIPSLTVDIRSMRKAMYGRTVLLVKNEGVVGTPFTVETHGIVRTLLKLE